jgi:signal transduction histidine kinase
MIVDNQFLYITLVVVLSFLSILLSTLLVLSRNKNKSLSDIVSNREEIANEAYVKFLNTSRDDAFNYIVEVQDKVNNFASKVEPQLNYFNTYGKAVPSPHTIILEEIDSAYKELRSILPEENKEK